MRRRERIDSFLSLLICLLACNLFAIYLSGCSDYRREWLGVWETRERNVFFTFAFKKDGTCILNQVFSKDGNISGTYSLEKTTFKLILGVTLYAGTWEKLNKNTLVLYCDPVEDWRLLPDNMVLTRKSTRHHH